MFPPALAALAALTLVPPAHASAKGWLIDQDLKIVVETKPVKGARSEPPMNLEFAIQYAVTDTKLRVDFSSQGTVLGFVFYDGAATWTCLSPATVGAAGGAAPRKKTAKRPPGKCQRAPGFIFPTAMRVFSSPAFQMRLTRFEAKAVGEKAQALGQPCSRYRVESGTGAAASGAKLAESAGARAVASPATQIAGDVRALSSTCVSDFIDMSRIVTPAVRQAAQAGAEAALVEYWAKGIELTKDTAANLVVLAGGQETRAAVKENVILKSVRQETISDDKFKKPADYVLAPMMGAAAMPKRK